jgi:N-acyl-D-aspartate/D-glutamate deacylase
VTSAADDVVGLADRGRLAPGNRADVNVIDTRAAADALAGRE